MNLYERIESAIEAQRKLGVAVRSNVWGVYWSPTLGKWEFNTSVPGMECACALGCLIMEEQPPVVGGGALTDQGKAAALLLGASPSEVDALVDGFDGLAYLPEDHDIDWYSVGLRLRSKYIDDAGVAGAA